MPKKKRSLIRVTYPNGKSICYNHAKYTVIEVLRRIDSTKYPEIKFESSGRRLITNNVDESDERYKEPICDGWWYINKFPNTDNKVAQLIEINRVLELGITIEHGPDLKITDFPENRVKSKRPKRKVRVILQDGTVFDDDQFISVFRDFVYHIGVEIVANRCKDITWKNEPFITTTNLNNNRAKLGDFRWFLEPSNTAEARKIMTIISKCCTINCKIELY